MTPSSSTTPNQNPIHLGTWIGVIAVLFIVVMVIVFSLASSSKATADNKAETEKKTKAVAAQVAAEEARNRAARETAQLIPEDPDFPRKGERFATEDEPVKAWLDPRKSYTRPSGRGAKYCLEGHPSICFEDKAVGVQVNATWQTFPAGRYLITPIGDDEISFRWWQ